MFLPIISLSNEKSFGYLKKKVKNEIISMSKWPIPKICINILYLENLKNSKKFIMKKYGLIIANTKNFHLKI